MFQIGLFQLNHIVFALDIHNPHPLSLTVLYISPINARQLLAPLVLLKRIFISQSEIDPKAGKLVNDNVGIVGFVIENILSHKGLLTVNGVNAYPRRVCATNVTPISLLVLNPVDGNEMLELSLGVRLPIVSL